MRQDPSIRGCAGFTLIELVLSIAILGIVVGLLSGLMSESLRSYGIVSDRRVSLDAVRLATGRFKRELILIESTDDIDSFSANSIQFDLPSETNISYSRSGNNLMRKSDVLANNVSYLDFDYLDSSGNETGTKANIRSVRIEMVLDSANNHGSHRIRTEVVLRNLYYDTFQ